jgi:N-hydroxyarylamine O-acetyltransferase
MTMTESNVNVAAYFKRIGYAGGQDASLQTLNGIVRRHTETIPFENLSPLTGQPVNLDPAALQRKIVDEQRGGYCFEQNLFVRNVLQQLGFQVTGLAARVMWNVPENTVLPRTHMLLLVKLDDEPHVVDVGFGGMVLTGVLKLQTDIEQSTPHEPFRFIRPANTFVMQAKVRSEWKSLYQFDLQEQVYADYEMANWHTSTHPTSRFVSNLIAARIAPDRRYALFNKELAIHHLHGETERDTLATAEELRETLEHDFLLRVPRTPEVDSALRRIVAGQ